MNITRKVYKDRIEWTNESGELHRLDGPAYESETYNAWYINGKLHREDGPAVECANGDKAWYLNGKQHREDGPAVEWINRHKKWRLNDIEYSEQDYNNYILKKRLQRILEL